MQTWAEIILSRGEKSNSKFWEEVNEISKRAYEEGRKVKLVFEIDKPEGRTINEVIPPDKPPTARTLKVLTWHEALMVESLWRNDDFAQSMSTLAHRAYMTGSPIRFTISLSNKAKVQ